LGVNIVDAGVLQHALGSRGSDDTSSARGGDQLDVDGSRLALNLGGHGVRFTELGAPVATSNGDDRELGEDDGASDGGSDFLGALDAQTEMTVKVTDSDKGLEAGALTGSGLLLNGHDLHHLVLELGQEQVDDLVLFDGHGEEVNLLDGANLAVLDQSTQFRDGNPNSVAFVETCATVSTVRSVPFLLFVLLSTTRSSTSATAATTTTKSSTFSRGCAHSSCL
jgi:hypothetical protein